MKAMEINDLAGAAAYVADNCEYTNIPLATTVYGPAGIAEVLGPFAAGISENEFQILREAAAGPIVFMERLDRHHFAHGWRELPVTGVFEVSDGRITVWRDYFDAAMFQSLLDPAA